MNQPAVSVVMGVYNAARHLESTIDSVLTQEGVELEFVVVDDGSTDGTAEMLDRLARADPRLRVLYQPNAGLTRALIRGCQQAKAPLIARQDASDVSLPGRLRLQSEVFRLHPQLAFVSCATEYVDDSGAFLYVNVGSGEAATPIDAVDLSRRHGMRDGPSHHGAAMFRRDTYERAGGYRAEFYYGQDWDLWYRLAELGQFCSLPQVLYRAQIGVHDISSNRKPQQEQLARASLEALRLRQAGRSDADVLVRAAAVRAARQSSNSATRDSAAGAHYFLGECLRRNGNLARARDHFRSAISSQPWHAKAWARLLQAGLSEHFGRR